MCTTLLKSCCEKFEQGYKAFEYRLKNCGLRGASATMCEQVGYLVADVVAKAGLGVMIRAAAAGEICYSVTNTAPFIDAYSYVVRLSTVPPLLDGLFLVMKLEHEQTNKLGIELGVASALYVFIVNK